VIGWALALALALGPFGPPGPIGPIGRGDGEATLVFGGDVALGRVVSGGIVSGGIRSIGGDDPLEGVAAVLRDADLAIVNLECALSDDGALAGEGIRLVAPTTAARALASVGVDLVSLANNHALDAGVAGLAATERALADAGDPGIDALGATRRVIVREVRGVRVGLVAMTDRINTSGWPLRHRIAWVATRDLSEALVDALRRARAELHADLWIVLVHWGEELAARPSAGQRRMARALVDAGATLVVGHGAHVVQEVERRGAGAILYNLGNLVFDMRAPVTRRGALARVRLSRAGVVDLELVSTEAGPDDRPRVTPTPVSP